MTVFLLPGLLCDETIWADQRAVLGDVVIPDFRYVNSIEAMAQIVLDAAPERFSVAGHSMGGLVAARGFTAWASRRERAVGAPRYRRPSARRKPEEAKRGELVELARSQGMAAMAARWLPPMLHPDHSALLGPLTEMVLRSTPETFANQQRALLDRPDARSVLPGIRCPTLVLCGRQDIWSPVAQHRETAASIPNARLVIVEDCGHMSPVEQPAAVTTALLSHFQNQTLQV